MLFEREEEEGRKKWIDLKWRGKERRSVFLCCWEGTGRRKEKVNWQEMRRIEKNCKFGSRRIEKGKWIDENDEDWNIKILIICQMINKCFQLWVKLNLERRNGSVVLGENLDSGVNCRWINRTSRGLNQMFMSEENMKKAKEEWK